jgi:hypothetical protein
VFQCVFVTIPPSRRLIISLRICTKALRQELLLCLHLSVPVLVLPPPNPENREFLPSYARAIASLLELGGEAALTRLSIRLPVSDRPNAPPPAHANSSAQAVQSAYQAEMEKKHRRRSSMGVPGPGARTSMHGQSLVVWSPSAAKVISTAGTGDGSAFAWEMWDCIRNICGYHPRLSLSEWSPMIFEVTTMDSDGEYYTPQLSISQILSHHHFPLFLDGLPNLRSSSSYPLKRSSQMPKAIRC